MKLRPQTDRGGCDVADCTAEWVHAANPDNTRRIFLCETHWATYVQSLHEAVAKRILSGAVRVFS